MSGRSALTSSLLHTRELEAEQCNRLVLAIFRIQQHRQLEALARTEHQWHCSEECDHRAFQLCRNVYKHLPLPTVDQRDAVPPRDPEVSSLGECWRITHHVDREGRLIRRRSSGLCCRTVRLGRRDRRCAAGLLRRAEGGRIRRPQRWCGRWLLGRGVRGAW